MTYPSERFPELKATVSSESWKRIVYYADEVYHDGEPLITYGVHSWHDFVSALCAYENHIPQEGFDRLYEDYKLFNEVVTERQ